MRLSIKMCRKASTLEDLCSEKRLRIVVRGMNIRIGWLIASICVGVGHLEWERIDESETCTSVEKSSCLSSTESD